MIPLAQSLDLVAQVTAAPEAPPTWPVVALALITALAPAVPLLLLWLRMKIQRDALVLGIEDAGPAAKAAVHKRTKAVGLSLTKDEIDAIKTTQKYRKLEG